MKLAECLAERSIPCDFFYTEDNPPLDISTGASVFLLAWLKKLRKYDFIYAGGEEAGQALFFCKRFLRGPILYDIHGDPEAQSALAREIHSSGVKTTASVRVRLVSWMAITCADHVITVSVPHTRALVNWGMPEDRVSIIRNGVDLDLFRRLPMPERPEFTFGYAGAFQTWQGIDNLIQAYERVDNPNIRLLIIGFSPEDIDLKRRLRDKFRDRVKLVDRADRETLVNLLSDVSILIIPRIEHPAIRHAFPTKFAEYAALGRPIMVNDVDETADFVRNYDCGFVSDCSPETMAKMMEEAAAVPVGELAAMGNRSRKMAEDNFSWPKIGDAYADLVGEVVARFRSDRRD